MLKPIPSRQKDIWLHIAEAIGVGFIFCVYVGFFVLAIGYQGLA